MKRKLNRKAAVAAILMGVGLVAPLESSAQSTGYVNGYVQSGGMSSNWASSNNWAWSYGNGWPYMNTQSNNWFDPRYGWVRSTYDGRSWTYYTYGYQLVYVWTANGYSERSYPGFAGVAYPVLYGPHP